MEKFVEIYPGSASLCHKQVNTPQNEQQLATQSVKMCIPEVNDVIAGKIAQCLLFPGQMFAHHDVTELVLLVAEMLACSQPGDIIKFKKTQPWNIHA